MTHYEWAEIGISILGGFLCVFAWVWNEARLAKKAAKDRYEALSATMLARVDAIEREGKNSLFNAKKDVLEHFVREHKVITDKFDDLKRDHDGSQAEFTQKLKEIVDTFTRTCDGLQAKLEHMTATIVGQYVPRQEIDSKFQRVDEKQDRMLNILYDLKK